MSLAGFEVYTGFWTDWSKGEVLGFTLTLSSSDGALLLSFIATWVTLVSLRLWKIITLTAHQIRTTDEQHDGLHFQTQVVLRNSSSPLDDAVTFWDQFKAWRTRADNRSQRTLGFAAFALGYYLIFAALSILSSQVSDSASKLRRINSEDCGTWILDDSAPRSTRNEALALKLAQDNLAAARYTRACYDTNKTSHECGVLPSSKVRWNQFVDQPCPFSNDSLCENGHTLQLQTWPINSHSDLGINTREKDRVLFFKESTCAPLPTTPFVRVVYSSAPSTNGTQQPLLLEYYYGPLAGITNFTYAYIPDAELTGYGYTLFQYGTSASESDNGQWVPLPSLQVPNADMSIFFIAFNSVYFSQPCDDPVFAAHDPETIDGLQGVEEQFYTPDRVVSVIACVEKYRLCNAKTGDCTAPVASNQLSSDDVVDKLGLSERQRAVARRISTAAQRTGIRESVMTRKSSALRASEQLFGSRQLSLPSTQWQIEVGSWFSEGLSRLQLLVQEYATRKSVDVEGGTVLQTWQDATAAGTADTDELCQKQLTRDTQGTVSFSGLGLIIILAVGLIIVIVSFCLEWRIESVNSRTGEHPSFRRLRWHHDEKLQLQRMLFSRLGLGEWIDLNDKFPVTTNRAIFSVPGRTDETPAGSQIELNVLSVAPTTRANDEERSGDQRASNGTIESRASASARNN